MPVPVPLDFPVPSSAPTVPRSGTVGAKTPQNAPAVPDFGTVGALTARESKIAALQAYNSAKESYICMSETKEHAI